jgi:branched-chain amino acid transport system substrate-binding protein
MPFLLAAFILLFPITIAAEEPIKIGVILPLSGPQAPAGVAAKRGFDFALEDFPEMRSRVQLIFEDSRYDNAASLSALKKLHSQDKVVGLYAWGTGPVQALSPVSESKGIATFAVTANREAVKDKHYLVQFNYHMEDCAKVLLRYMSENSVREVPVIHADVEFYSVFLQRLNEQKSDGMAFPIIASLTPTEMDFRSYLGKLRAKKPDAVAVFLMNGQLRHFYKQLGELRMSFPTLTSLIIDDTDEIRGAGSAVEGALFSAPFVTEEFRSRYRERYNTESQMAWAANSYDFIRVLRLALNNNFTPHSSEELLVKFRTVDPGSGVSGPLKAIASERGHAVKFGVVLKRVTSGETATIPGTFVQ